MMREREHDFAGWAEDTAKAIEEGRWSEIDRASLADEVLDLGKTERYRLESALRVILLYMLKMKHQPLMRSWDLSILEQRRRIKRYLKQSPSLRTQYDELLEDAYGDARIQAANETGLDIEAFPAPCEWSFAEVMGE